MSQPDPDAARIAALAAATGLSEEQVRALETAQRDPALAGPMAGTIQQDPVTRDAAVRVPGVDGKPFWWVISQQDSSCTRDFNPTKEWPDITPTDEDA